MKIVEIETIPLRFSFDPEKAYGASRVLMSQRTALLVKVVTDEGLTGIGEAWGPPEVGARIIQDVIKPFFVGTDPFDHEVTWNRVVNTFYHHGAKGATIWALSGIDIAIWDLMGKAVGLPVCKLLGGQARDRVLAYASDGYFGRDLFNLRDLRDQTEKAMAEGYRAIKIKVGLGIKEDIKRVELVRELAGREVLLLVDINGNYTADLAVQAGRAFAPYDLHWIEEPVAPQDLEGYQRLKEALDIPIAGGEAEYTRQGFRHLISGRLVDIVQPDVCKCGGLTEARLITRMAQAWHLRVSPHVFTGAVGIAASLHLAASLPSSPSSIYEPVPLLFEFDRTPNPLREEILEEGWRIEEGSIVVPERPGLGIVIDEKALARYRV